MNDPALHPSSSTSPRTVLALAAVTAIFAALLYGPSISGEFVYDDPIYIVQNPHIRTLNSRTLAWALSGYYQANWHPITWLSHALDLALFGHETSGHHVVNLFLHALTCVLLLGLLVRMTGRVGPALVAALLFACHPIQVESVAWISERKTLLCVFFFMLTAHAYVSYARKPALGRYAWVVLGFLAALASKPMAVTIPFALWLFDYWPLKRWSAKALLEKIPLFMMSAAGAAVTVFTQTADQAMTPFHIIGIGSRIQNALVSYMTYVGKLFLPMRLTPYYPYPGMEAPLLHPAIVTGCAILLGVLTMTAIARRRRQPYLLVGWLLFLGTMLPMIGLIQVGRQAMADRFMYMPMLGLLIMIVWSVTDVLDVMFKKQLRPFASSDNEDSPGAAEAPARSAVLETAILKRFKGGVGVGVGLVVVGLSWRTVDQIAVWRDEETLWTHAKTLAPQSPFPPRKLAFVELSKAPTETTLQNAVDYLDQAAKLEKDALQKAALHLKLASLLARQDRLWPAVLSMEEAIRWAPNQARYRGYLAYLRDRLVAANIGSSESRRILIEQARRDYLIALILEGSDEEMAEIHKRYAAFLVQQGEPAQAGAEYRQSLALRPNPKVYLALAELYLHTDRPDQARATLDEARARFPDDQEMLQAFRRMSSPDASPD